ncbi:MAG: hypothetical protein NWR72_12710 [Bacteroidia bacterium]|nr:hypothetical protein [Bacteroidia bacterium]
MAKSFLDTLDDAYDDHVLSDLIPDSRKPKQASRTRTSASSEKKAPSRKKSFLHTIEENISENKPRRSAATTSSSKRKSFLETIEEAYDQAAFDDLMPTRSWTKKDASDFSDVNAIEKKFGAMVTPAVLARVKQIAKSKGVSVQDVIQRALDLYLKSEE